MPNSKDYKTCLNPSLMLGALRAATETVASGTPVGGLGAIGINSLGAQMTTLGTAKFFADDQVPVLIDSNDHAETTRLINSWQGTCKCLTKIGMVAYVPRARLVELADHASVNYVEPSTRLEPHSNLAHASARLVTDGERTVPQTGKGVLVGVVDTGIDPDHPAFKLDGKTRIVDYLDQEKNQRFTAADIDAGNASSDENGHGTHVAGIAAGNGAGSSDPLGGVAHEADLAIVKTTFSSGDIAAAVQHIFALADERDQPCVINLSLGGHMGGHDGTTITERIIDQLSGPGRIVVASAGNEGGSNMHTHTVLDATSVQPDRFVADLALQAQMVPTQSGPQLLGMCFVEVWHQREDAVSVQLRTPSGQLLSAPELGQESFDMSTTFVAATHQRHPYSDAHVTTFRIIALPQPKLLTGWSVIFTEDREAGGVKVGTVHAWTSRSTDAVFTSNATDSNLVGMPGTSFSAVTVASYATRNRWSSRAPNQADGTFFANAVNLEDISHFSSSGPTRDGQNKPDIAGPGQLVLAPLSSASGQRDTPDFLRMGDGVPYVAMQGTSMSAPYVTGAIALLLEKHPDLDWAEVKRRLIKSARQDEHTRPCWNAHWGHGKLDVVRLLNIEPG